MKTIIIEDESAAARQLQAILREISPEIQIIAVLDSIAESVEWFNSNKIADLVFMDIHLADGSAFEIFNRTKILSPIIFTTAFDEYALKAFKVNSIDYIVKPIDIKSVKDALDKFRALTSFHNQSETIKNLFESLKITRQKGQTHFLLPVGGSKLLPLSTTDIASISIKNGVVRASLFTNKSYSMENTLDELSELLNPQDFFRANRQYIISRSAILDIDLWFGSRLSVNLVIPLHERIIISKSRVPEFKKWYSNY